MLGIYLDDYRSKKGNRTFIYTVECTPEEKEALEDAKGDNYKEDANGKPLFYTINYVGEEIDIIITTNGNVIAKNSEFEKMNSLAKQFGGNLGEQIAAKAAESLMSNMLRRPVQVSKPAFVEKEVEDLSQV